MKKKKILLFFAALLLCCFIPCFNALAENNFVSAEKKEVPEGNSFSYSIDLTALPEELKAAPYTMAISGGNLIKDVTFDQNLRPSYDAEKDLYTIASDRLTDIETLAVTVDFTFEAVAGQQITITTTAAGGQAEEVKGDLTVTITAAEPTTEEDDSQNPEEDNAIIGDIGDLGNIADMDAGTVSNGDSTAAYSGSANNYLKSLSVRGLDLSSGFHKTNTSYFLTVDAKTSNLTVSAKADDGKATVVVAGNTELKNGMNKVLISVTAENGAVRYYRIYVTKEAN